MHLLSRIYKLSCLLMLLLSVDSVNIHAQEVFYGKEQRFNYREGKYDIIGRIGSRIVTYKTMDQKHYLDFYNDSMDHKAIVELDFIPKKASYIHFTNLDQYISVSYKVEEKGNITLYGATLDVNGIIRDKPRVIAQMKSSWFGFQRHEWQAISSEDKRKIAIVAKGGKDRNELVMILMTPSWDTLIFTTKLLEKYEEIDEIAFHHAVLSDDGYIAIPGYNIAYRGKMKSAGLLVYNLQGGNDSMALYPISNSKYVLSDFTIKVDNERKQLRMAGLAEEKGRSSMTATILHDINYHTQRISDTPRFLNHPEAFLKALSDKGWKKAMQHHKVKDIILVDDGSVILLTEYHRIDERNNYNGSYLGFDPYYANGVDMVLRGNTIEHYYGDISIMRYNKDILEWSEFVRKSQISQDDDGMFSSFGMINTGGSLVMVFNNFGRGNSAIGISAINKSGQIQLANYSELAAKSDWAMQAGQQIGLTELLVPSFKRNNLAFHRVVFR